MSKPCVRGSSSETPAIWPFNADYTQCLSHEETCPSGKTCSSSTHGHSKKSCFFLYCSTTRCVPRRGQPQRSRSPCRSKGHDLFVARKQRSRSPCPPRSAPRNLPPDPWFRADFPEVVVTAQQTPRERVVGDERIKPW